MFCFLEVKELDRGVRGYNCRVVYKEIMREMVLEEDKLCDIGY